jgi:hypothetical protein
MIEVFPGENIQYTPDVYDSIIFSMMDAKNKLAYSPQNCKEYTLQYTYSTLRDSTPGVYLEEVRMAVHGIYKYAEQSLDLLHQVEKELKIEPLSFVNTNKANTWLIFRGHKDWFISPPMLSLYGLLIRTGQYHTIGQSVFETIEKSTGRDSSIWVNGAKEGLNFIIKHGFKKVFGSTKSQQSDNWTYGGSLTHDSGIKTFGSGKHSSGDLARFVSVWKDCRMTANLGCLDAPIFTPAFPATPATPALPATPQTPALPATPPTTNAGPSMTNVAPPTDAVPTLEVQVAVDNPPTLLSKIKKFFGG